LEFNSVAVNHFNLSNGVIKNNTNFVATIDTNAVNFSFNVDN